ncbi:hypothetical protein CI610_03246 [invertebrate metagenome]|uniref:Uncharacterized protein n=1 Tax=invertebrate metagenome TaxID=1711999 RepID=A0A2H9T3P8_9ZZZZ
MKSIFILLCLRYKLTKLFDVSLTGDDQHEDTEDM